MYKKFKRSQKHYRKTPEKLSSTVLSKSFDSHVQPVHCESKLFCRLVPDGFAEVFRPMMEYEKFSTYAFRLIAKKRYTEHEIEKKLKMRGADDDVCKRIIERLKELNYLDDRKFARDYIDYRVKASPRGRFLISRELRNKGINKDLLETVLDETPLDELELAKQLVAKKTAKISKLPLMKQKAKLYQFLTSRGFARETVYKAIELCYNSSVNQDQ